jgi:hypothetical protein
MALLWREKLFHACELASKTAGVSSTCEEYSKPLEALSQSTATSLPF